jgi:hypothetical protein
MPSKRSYPKRNCRNLVCNKSYIPHDRRQLYCEPQCRINAANDRRYEENKKGYSKEKLLRATDKKLERVYDALMLKHPKTVPIDILKYESIDLSLCVQTQVNEKTKGVIRWLYSYGVEVANKEQQTFIIHKRTNSV